MADGDGSVQSQLTPMVADLQFDPGYGPTIVDTVTGRRYRVTSADGILVLVEVT